MQNALMVWIAVGLVAALAGVGGYHYERAAKAPPPAPEMAAAPAGIAPEAEKPQTTEVSASSVPVCVELARPQSDDQRHYVPVPSRESASVMGYVAAARPVKQVVVNDVPAATYTADYLPYGAPSGYVAVGFNAPLVLAPDTVLNVLVTDADGYRQTVIFEPNRAYAYNRVHELYLAAPSDPYACLRLANAFAVLGDYDDCLPLYHRCLSLNAGFYVGSFFLGLSLFDCNRYDDAWAEFHRCTLVAPDFYPAFYGLGECYHARGYDDYALAQLGWVARRDPQFVEASWRMGDIYAGRHDWRHAESEYRQAVRHDPKFAAAHLGLGEALAHRGRWNAAANEIRTGAGLNPKDPRASHYLTAALAHQAPTHIAQVGSSGFAGRRYARAAGAAALGVGAAAVASHARRTSGQEQASRGLVQHQGAEPSHVAQTQTAHAPTGAGTSHAATVNHSSGGVSHPQATHHSSAGSSGHRAVSHRSGGASHPQATHRSSAGSSGHRVVSHRSGGGYSHPQAAHRSVGGGGSRARTVSHGYGGGGHTSRAPAMRAPSRGGGGGRAPSSGGRHRR